jgi:hypothetical protein
MTMVAHPYNQDGHGCIAVQENSSIDHISEMPSTKQVWQSGLICKVPQGKFVIIQVFKQSQETGYWCLTPVILGTQEAEIRRITVGKLFVRP